MNSYLSYDQLIKMNNHDSNLMISVEEYAKVPSELYVIVSRSSFILSINIIEDIVFKTLVNVPQNLANILSNDQCYLSTSIFDHLNALPVLYEECCIFLSICSR